MNEDRKAKQDAFYADEPWAKLATQAGFRPWTTESSAREAFRYCAENMVPAQAAEIAALRAALDEAEDRIRKICLDALISYGQVEAERDALAAQLDDANARADRLEAAVIAAAKIGQIVGFLGFDEARIEAFREDCGPDLWEKARAHLGAKP